MKNLIKLTLLVIMLYGCKKVADGNLAGDKKIIGRLFLLDTLTKNSVNLPLAKKKVTIQVSSSPDSANYLFSTLTDADGYFTFGNLTEKESYVISYREIVDGIVYTGHTTATTPDNKVSITSKIDEQAQSGILLTVKDGSGNNLKGATVCIYNSSTNDGYIQGNCEGSSASRKSDTLGRVPVFGIREGTYYSVSTMVINGVTLLSRDTFIVTNKVNRKNLYLKKPNGIHIVTTDINDDLVGNAAVCIFTSRLLYEKGGCEGSNIQISTSTFGTTDYYTLPKGTFYFFSSKIVGKDTLTGTSTLVYSDQQATINLKLKKK